MEMISPPEVNGEVVETNVHSISNPFYDDGSDFASEEDHSEDLNEIEYTLHAQRQNEERDLHFTFVHNVHESVA